MEVDGLGARCALPSCRHLDYLPFTCPHCSLSFCQSHRTAPSHSCRAAAVSRPDVPTCPLCSAAVPIPPGSTASLAVSRHVDAGCPKRVRSNPPCAFPSCPVRDVAATRCPACAQLFCLAHRLEADHVCPVAAARAPNPRQDPFGNRLRGADRRPAKKTSSPRRAKPVGKGDSQIRLDFSNTPATPAGDKAVDPADRVAVAVFFPAGSKVQPRYMYFSGRQSAGRIIDVLRKQVPGLPEPRDGERYCLYAVKRGVSGVNLLPHITPLKDLPKEVLQSGDVVVLEKDGAGLDQTWVTALQKAGSSPRFSSARRKFGHASGSKKENCAVA